MSGKQEPPFPTPTPAGAQGRGLTLHSACTRQYDTGHRGGQGGSPHQACSQLLWSIHGIPFSHSPSPEDISVFLLPNLCCASKICSWAASRVEQAKPRSVEKEGGGAGQGSDQTKKGHGKRVLRPSKHRLTSLLERTDLLLSPDCWLQCALGQSSGNPWDGAPLIQLSSKKEPHLLSRAASNCVGVPVATQREEGPAAPHVES